MSELSVGSHRAAAARSERGAKPVDADAVSEALRHGPRGALFVSAVSVSLLLVIWLAFYFLLFLPRGSIG